MDGETAAVDRLAAGLLKPLPSNFVERPWGGTRIREYKGLCPLPDQLETTGLALGEAFEIAAYDADEEAREHPSRLRFDDGSELALPALLRRHADTLLGPVFAARHGGAFPLLPKTLDVKELLSVQGHPEGNTEAYVIIDADPGATIRVGFNRDVDPSQLDEELTVGRARQQRLLEWVGDRCEPARLQALLAPWLASRDEEWGDLPAELRELLEARGSDAVRLLEQLKSLYWRVLDSMNEIAVEPGMIVHNANPARITAGTGRAPSAEVHALGNPEAREILMLEIRRPGPTFRAWDNVRFPLRRIDVGAAVGALNLRRVEPDELVTPASPLPGRPGAHASVASASFELEHLRPSAGAPVAVPRSAVHSLHSLGSPVELYSEDGRPLGSMRRGESAIVSAGVGGYHVACDRAGAEVVKVSLPS